MNKKLQAHSAIFLANTIFGLGVPVTKLLLDDWVYLNLIGKQNLANPFRLFFSKSHHDWPLRGSLKLKAKSGNRGQWLVFSGQKCGGRFHHGAQERTFPCSSLLVVKQQAEGGHRLGLMDDRAFIHGDRPMAVHERVHHGE